MCSAGASGCAFTMHRIMSQSSRPKQHVWSCAHLWRAAGSGPQVLGWVCDAGLFEPQHALAAVRVLARVSAPGQRACTGGVCGCAGMKRRCGGQVRAAVGTSTNQLLPRPSRPFGPAPLSGGCTRASTIFPHPLPPSLSPSLPPSLPPSLLPSLCLPPSLPACSPSSSSMVQYSQDHRSSRRPRSASACAFTEA